MAKSGITVDVVVDDRAMQALTKIARSLHESPPEVRVGVFADKGGATVADESGLSNVEKAAIHELGAPEANIPERSFLRSTMTQHSAEYASMITKLVPKMLSGTLTAEQAFNVIGAKIVADVNRKVRVEGVGPPLQPETIARKGSSRALIDTASMIQSVTWVVLRGAPTADVL